MAHNESYIILKAGDMHPDYIKPGLSVRATLTVGSGKYNELVNEAITLGSEGTMNFVGWMEFGNMETTNLAVELIDKYVTDNTFKKQVKAMGNKAVFIAECSKAVEKQPFTSYAHSMLEEYINSNQVATLAIDIMPKMNEFIQASKEIKPSKLEGSYIKLALSADPKFLKACFPADPKFFRYFASLFKSLKMELDITTNLDDVLPSLIGDMISGEPWADRVSGAMEYLKAVLTEMNLATVLKGAGSVGRVFMCIPPCFSLEVDLSIDGLAELF